MINYYNRQNKIMETEKVVGDKSIKAIYSTPIGKGVLELFLKKRLFTKLYGSYCDTEYSSKKIDNFIKEYDINMNRYKKNFSFEFNSFNDFFTRELKSDHLNINKDKSTLISPCDGKLLAYSNINVDKIIQVKDFTYSLKELIGDETLANTYSNGLCLVFRLCPTDYHRFHFIDNGFCSTTSKIPGTYYSVNPIALENKAKLFCQNKREWSLLNSDNFDKVLYVEVGASCVGTIIQSYDSESKITRGEEKGYFKFGGSTVILFIKDGICKIDDDILEHSKEGIETSVMFSESIGTKISYIRSKR